MRETGEAGEGFGRDEHSLTAQLHGADDSSQVDVAATLAGAEECALHLRCTSENCGARIGDAEAAVSVAVEAELCAGVGGGELVEDGGDFFG